MSFLIFYGLKLREFLWIWLKICSLKMITWQNFPSVVCLHILWSQMSTSGWCVSANVEIVGGGELKVLKVTDSALTTPHRERWETGYLQISSVSYSENKRHIVVVYQVSFQVHKHYSRALDMGTFWWIFIKGKETNSQKLFRGDCRCCFKTLYFNF